MTGPVDPLWERELPGTQACQMTGLVISHGKSELVGKQACQMTGPVDLPLMNNEPIKQIEHICKPMLSATLENRPSGDHARQICGCMDTITIENKPSGSHARQICGRMDTITAFLGLGEVSLLLTGTTKTVRTPGGRDQWDPENKMKKHKEQHAELEKKTMEVEWAPATPARESTQPSARARIRNMNNSKTHLVVTFNGSKQQQMKTKKKGMNNENLNKKFQWVTATLSQENLDYISSQPSYVLMMGANPGRDKDKDK